MSPLGITSRMTMGNILELIFGKAASCTGDLMDGFDEQDFQSPIDDKINTIQSILRKAGFSPSGKETFIDGITGEMIQTPVMTGVVSYVKLNHMVHKKAHARSNGQVHMLTRQPNEGRKQGGGLRFGQMETECLLAHSAAEIIRERTMSNSDEFECYICSKCGLFADGNVDIGFFFCRVCSSDLHLQEVKLPYTSKLLVQELNGIGIKVKFHL